MPARQLVDSAAPLGDNPLIPGNGAQAFDWPHFAARSGEEGRRWIEEYRRPEFQRIAGAAHQALFLLRGRQLDAGRARLAEAEAGLRSLQGATASILRVIERFYFGVLAFQQYCDEDFGGAAASLHRAHEAVAAAIGDRRFLLPLANHCHELRLHHARVARNRRRWPEMWSHIAAARAMMEDQLPLCVLADGTAVHFSTLGAFYGTLPELNVEELEFLAGQLDARLRLQLFERFVGRLCAIPGFVIPYP
jgi:hypothetical protein